MNLSLEEPSIHLSTEVQCETTPVPLVVLNDPKDTKQTRPW